MSGSTFNKMMADQNKKLNKIIISSNRKIIYRAQPDTKQKYISYLQKEFEKPVMMIGDGSNDVSAIIQADIGIGVIGENKTIQKVSDIVVNNWIVIPSLIKISIIVDQLLVIFLIG